MANIFLPFGLNLKQMLPRSPAPLFKTLIPFLLGILCAIRLNIFNSLYLLIVCLPFLGWLTLQILRPSRFATYSNRWTTGVAAYFILFCSGYELSLLNTSIYNENHFSKSRNEALFIAIVKEPIVEKEKGFRTVLEVTSVYENTKQVRTIGKCLAWFLKDSLSKEIKYGDEILFTAMPKEVSPPGNAGQFDYKKFLSYRNIFQQVTIAPGKWKLLDRHKGNSLVEAALGLKERFLNVFRQNQVTGQDYAVLSALILGDEDEINRDTMNAFAASGTLHILSVSGMHVAIIFLALERILFFMNRKQSLKIIKSILLMFLLGAYALLTGLSPPVLRSAIMLGLIVFGSALGRQKVTINIVAASALALLCYNPYYIMDIGFQLSYLAVIGIVLLYERINNWVTFRMWLMKEAWSIIAASLAAQLATFPLVLFYFHQFPNYFLLSNLIVIPLAAFIIYGGILLLLCSSWAWGALLIGKAVGWLTHLLNSFVMQVEHLPHALINLSIGVIETYLIYIAILSFIYFFTRKRFGYLITSLSVFCLILIIRITEVIHLRML